MGEYRKKAVNISNMSLISYHGIMYVIAGFGNWPPDSHTSINTAISADTTWSPE